MDENHHGRTGSDLAASEIKLWLPALAPREQEKLDRLRRKLKKSASNWTGFSGRTLWDWLQFFGVLAIPFVVAGATLFFTQQITLQQAQLSAAANKQQHQTDIQIATDQQQASVLQIYLDHISDLLLTDRLRESKPGDEVRNVARVRTLTALQQLDGARKGLLLQFLYQAQLITNPKSALDYSNPVISLANADLTGLHLGGSDYYRQIGKLGLAKRYSFKGLTPLMVPVPPMLEKAIGYSGDARFVSFDWTPGGDEADYDDGQSGGTGNWQGYLAFIQHPTVHPELAHFQLGNSDQEAQHRMILDRQERKLYVATIKEAQHFLAQQWPKAEPVHLTKKEWEALKARIISEMRQRQQDIDIETIHKQIEEQFALIEALQTWLNQYVAN